MLPEPTKHEKNVAALIHIAGIFAPLWLPFVAYAVTKSSSKFISSHAWQEAIEGIVWKALLLLVMIVSLSWTAVRLVYHFQTNWETFNWGEVAFRLILSIAIFGSLFLWNLIQALNQARKAWAGQWPKRVMKQLAKAQKLGAETPLP